MIAKPQAWTAANAVMFLMFAFSVVVQFNDPDPIAWAAMYGAAAYVCALEVRRRNQPWLPATIAAAALLWAGLIAPRVIGRVPFTDMFAEFEMKDLGVEESREMYGLVLVALWMGAVALAGIRRRKQDADDSGAAD
jgi:hypothetical protein